jgi:hypothetical protein
VRSDLRPSIKQVRQVKRPVISRGENSQPDAKTLKSILPFIRPCELINVPF